MTYGESILEEIVSQLTGATTGAINLAMWNVLDEFCTRSNAWQEEIELVLAEGVIKYALPVPNGSALVRVMRATHRGFGIRETGSDSINMRGRIQATFFDEDNAEFTPSDTVLGYAVFTPEYITINSLPTLAATAVPMLMTLALKPQRGVNGADDNPIDFLPDWLIDRYRMVFLDGVLWRMMAQASRPYSNPTLAQYHAQKFRGGVTGARADQVIGPLYGNGPVASPGGYRA